MVCFVDSGIVPIRERWTRRWCVKMCVVFIVDWLYINAWWKRDAKGSLLGGEARTSLLVYKSLNVDLTMDRDNIQQSKNYIFSL